MDLAPLKVVYKILKAGMATNLIERQIQKNSIFRIYIAYITSL